MNVSCSHELKFWFAPTVKLEIWLKNRPISRLLSPKNALLKTKLSFVWFPNTCVRPYIFFQNTWLFSKIKKKTLLVNETENLITVNVKPRHSLIHAVNFRGNQTSSLAEFSTTVTLRLLEVDERRGDFKCEICALK